MKFNAINKAEKAYKVELSKVYENRRTKLAVKIVCSIFFFAVYIPQILGEVCLRVFNSCT